ncbi:hypothetical protein Atai01_64370 [Amycolatopsis taiwanensis]|uniref:Uncharacterized protein n=1 Tax=Amycolatopsis taiwanensis TaxID=342230 RepID=A0A9W6VFN9_9PSEU|nr:hypothetical protein Atai01_64370 [Amycolatopsis taiwanensis]
MHVVADVEAGVLDPHRVHQVQRRIVQFPPEFRNEPDTLIQISDKIVEAVPTGDGRAVQSEQRTDVQRLRSRFEI